MATYRLHNSTQIQEVNLLSKSESEDEPRYQPASNLGTGRKNGRKPVGQLFDNTLAPERLVFKANKDSSHEKRGRTERGGRHANYLERDEGAAPSDYEQEDSEYSVDIEKDDQVPDMRPKPPL